MPGWARSSPVSWSGPCATCGRPSSASSPATAEPATTRARRARLGRRNQAPDTRERAGPSPGPFVLGGYRFATSAPQTPRLLDEVDESVGLVAKRYPGAVQRLVEVARALRVGLLHPVVGEERQSRCSSAPIDHVEDLAHALVGVLQRRMPDVGVRPTGVIAGVRPDEVHAPEHRRRVAVFAAP